MSAAFLRLWGWPILIAALSASGLSSALVSDGWGDAWSWLALGAPVAVTARCAMPRRQQEKSKRIP